MGKGFLKVTKGLIGYSQVAMCGRLRVPVIDFLGNGQLLLVVLYGLIMVTSKKNNEFLSVKVDGK